MPDRALPIVAFLVCAGCWISRSQAQFGQTAPGRPTRAFTSRPATGVNSDLVREGHALFVRNWRTWGSLEGSKGDGIGPMFNADSCLAAPRADGAVPAAKVLTPAPMPLIRGRRGAAPATFSVPIDTR